MDIQEVFEKYRKEFLKFELIENPRCARADLCAFLLLQELAPGTSDMVSAAEHDVIWLDVDMDKLEEVVTEEQLRELNRCGVIYDNEYRCLAMRV